MKKTLKRLVLLFLALLILLVGGSALLAGLYKEQIGEQLLAQLNNALLTEARVQEFDLSLIRSFPNVSASLVGLEVMDTQGERLCRAGALSASMSLFSVLGNTLRIRSIRLSDARINLRIDRQGRGNYQIFKPREKEGGGRSTGISLDRASLEQVELFYEDLRQDLKLEGQIREARLSGDFSARQFVLQTGARLQSGFVARKGQRFLTGVPLACEGKVQVDLEAGGFQLDGLEVQVGRNTFFVDGQVVREGGWSDYKLELVSRNGSLASLTELLPGNFRETLGGLESRGDFQLQATLDGRTLHGELPAVEAVFRLENGRLSSPLLKGDFRDVDLLATFTNGQDRTWESSTFELRRLKGYFQRELLEAQLKLTNLRKPYLQLEATGALPLASIYPLFDNPRITDGDGEIELKTLKLSGLFSDMVNTGRIHRVKADGHLEFDDASLLVNGSELILDRGEVLLQNNELTVRDLKLEGPGTELEFNGSARNLLPVLLADSLNSKLAELDFRAELVGDRLSIDRLLSTLDLGMVSADQQYSAPSEAEAIRARQVRARQRLTGMLKGSFKTRIRSFQYGKLEGEGFAGKLEVSDNVVSINGTTRAMGGEFQLDGQLFFERAPRLVAELAGSGVNVSEFFRQSDNFGQEVLTHRELSGTLEAKIALEAHFDELGNFQQDKLRVLAGLGITEGELKDFELLENFSAVLKERDLERIRFSDLENYLEIRDNRLYLPVMFIQSSAINLTVSGVHAFDNTFQYNIKANVLQAMGQKIKRHDNDLRPVKARKKGFVNLYYQIRGQGDRMETRTARRAVLNEFQRSSTHRRSIMLGLEERFGYVKLVEEPKEWRDIPEYREDPADEAVEFLDWEKEGGQF